MGGDDAAAARRVAQAALKRAIVLACGWVAGEDLGVMLARALLWLATAVLVAGCYECNLENCKDGCCSAQGVCIVAPTSDRECGMGGLLCQDCTEKPNFRCIQSTCQSTCNATTCSGCCTQGGICLAPASQTDTACGGGGTVCTTCGTGQRCERQASGLPGRCCTTAGRTCTRSYDCCSGLTCRTTAGGGLTCQ